MSVSSTNKAEQEQEQQRADQEQVEKVYQALVRKEKKGFERGEKKKFFESIGNRYGVSAYTVKNVYYDRVKKELAEEKNKKQDAENEKKERKAKFKVISNEKIGNTDNVGKSTVSTEKEKEKVESQSKADESEKLVEGNEPKNSEKDGVDKNAVALTKTETKSEDNDDTTQKVDKPKSIELDSEGRPLKPPYKYGDIIQVRVDHITDFGAFCYTLDEYEYKGLLHISEIKNLFVDNVSDYLEVGDIVDVKVILANPNRLQFSTRELPMKSKKDKDKEENMKDSTTQKNPPINVIGEQFGDLKQKVRTVIPSTKKAEIKTEEKPVQTNISQDDKEFAELMNDGADLNEDEMNKIVEEAEIQSETVEVKQEQDDTTTIKAFDKLKNLSVTSEREYTDIQKYLNNKIGALSPQAQLELLNILESNGVFKSSMAISEVAKTFNVDYGLIFLNQVKSQLRKDECL